MSVARHTLPVGHVTEVGVVGDGVIHQLHSDSSALVRQRRPQRCFRHRVWMASCDDCRTAHSARLIKASRTPAAADPGPTGQDDAGD